MAFRASIVPQATQALERVRSMAPQAAQAGLGRAQERVGGAMQKAKDRMGGAMAKAKEKMGAAKRAMPMAGKMPPKAKGNPMAFRKTGAARRGPAY